MKKAQGTKVESILGELADLPVLDQLQVYSKLVKQVGQLSALLDLFSMYPSMEVHKPKSVESLRITACKSVSWADVCSNINKIGSLLSRYNFSFDIHCIHTIEGKGVISVQTVITPVPHKLRFLINDLDEDSITSNELKDLFIPPENNEK